MRNIFLSTARTSLKAMNNDDLKNLTFKHNLEWSEFRKKKTALYIQIEPKEMEFYSFLLNILYTQAFDYFMSNKVNIGLPVFCLLDEFGHLKINKLETVITNIRKHKVSLSLVVQSMSQIEKKYGHHDAKSITNGGIASKLFLSGCDMKTARMIESMLGYHENQIMRASDIRTIKNNQAIFIHYNSKPAKIKIKRFYQSLLFKNYSKLPPYIDNHNMKFSSVKLIDLKRV